MGNLLDELELCDRVEWIAARDERLANATGETTPIDGASVRDYWDVASTEEGERLAVAVHRLVALGKITIEGEVAVRFDQKEFVGGPGDHYGNVVFDFSRRADMQEYFPVSEETLVLPATGDFGPAYAAVALCGRLGLAAFMLDTRDGGGEVRVQQMPDAVFRKLSEL